MQKIVHFLKKIDKNMALVAIAVVGVLIVGALIYANSNPNFSVAGIFGQSDKTIAQKAVDYVNNNGLSQTPVSMVGETSRESGLIKFKLKVGTAEYDTYATKDGKLFFPQVFNMAKDDSKKTDDKTGDAKPSESVDAKKVIDSIKKSDSPMLEAYVVSRCPFGLQMQRAMYAAIQGAPELAKYVTVKYMGGVNSDGKTISSMHGEEEATENLRQICIRDEQATKYWPYVACQMKKGDTAGCEKSTGVDSAKLNSCMTNPAKGVAYAKKDFDLNTKYSVTGSPTLVLGNAVLPEFDSNNQPIFGGRSADAIKTMVCDAFNSKASFCSKTLDTAGVATSFSESTAASGNSGNSGANCAPAQ